MRILLTGVTGYVGKRVLPALIEQGHEVICCVREKNRLSLHKKLLEKVEVVEVDFLDENLPETLPVEIDAAYYLIHSMSTSKARFADLESRSALNFKRYMETTGVKQVIYLSGISNYNKLSKHLSSRRKVEELLQSEKYALTVLRAGIIVGSGSASFEIIRDIVEKLPIMITPKWILTKSQPIAVRDVITFLVKVLHHPKCVNKTFDIGGPEILTYKDMMLQYAEMRGLKRRIYTTSLITPRISSYWLFFITSVSYKLAISLADSMKSEVICKDNQLAEILNIQPITYKTALKYAFLRIKQHLVLSSWKDSMISSSLGLTLSDFIEVPKFGCYKNEKAMKVDDIDRVIQNIWTIGGDKGYYYADWLWKIRGWFDMLVGGVGLRRGRKLPNEISQGESLDFWRVLYASREKKRLLLFAEMKLPGEAWLEFRIDDDGVLHQTATFRPRGILGRFYWLATSPFHFFIFDGMIRNIARTN